MTSSLETTTTRVGRALRLTRAGVVFDVAVLVAMVVTATVRHGDWGYPGTVVIAFLALTWLALLARTRWPLAALEAVVVLEALHVALVPLSAREVVLPLAMGAYQPVPLATMAAAWSFASRRPAARSWAVGLGAAAVLLGTSLLAQPRALLATDMVMFDLVVLATGAGVYIASRRERAARLEQAREEDVRRSVVAERLRIARELHDVLAHHLTLVNAQAGVADYLLRTDPATASTALQGISEHTRRALEEIRTTVGLLRQAEDPAAPQDGAAALQPTPGLDRLDDLVNSMRGTGIHLEVIVNGAPQPLVPSTDLAAYRVAQEALTNAAKHAPGAVVHVQLTWSRQQLELTIKNGPATEERRQALVSGAGHGLIGMRERALACGGTLTAGRTATGGFLVQASLPVDGKGHHSGVDDSGPAASSAAGDALPIPRNGPR